MRRLHAVRMLGVVLCVVFVGMSLYCGLGGRCRAGERIRYYAGRISGGWGSTDAVVAQPSGDGISMRPAVIALPKPAHSAMALGEALRARRSLRTYAQKPLTLMQLSQLLFAAQGITAEEAGYQLRAAPSAGALYPFDIYAIVHSVEGLDRGVYRYSPGGHSLALVESGDFRSRLVEGCYGQGFAGTAGVVFIMSATPSRTSSRYGERGFRYIDMEAGHISQNIYLQATSLGLGSVAIGAFEGRAVNELIGVDGRNEAVVYLHAVGTL